MAEAGGVPPPQPHSQSPTTMEAYQWAYSIVDSSRVSTFFISILLIVYGSFRSLALEEDNKNANLEQDAKDKENNVKSEERTSGKDKSIVGLILNTKIPCFYSFGFFPGPMASLNCPCPTFIQDLFLTFSAGF